MRKLKYVFNLSIISLICIGVSGCFSGWGSIHDYELYDSGKPKKTYETHFYENSFHEQENLFYHSSEYYENGRLKLEEWSEFNRPLYRLEFYESGQLKSEERFINGELDYGAYYKEDGQVKPTTGQLIDWTTRKNLHKK
ncbi:MAG: hypothetical protein JXA96_00340 [Sedimentisphaerales bacterium]|nr:hypothetical protein [Sedimentisphaerales bacterium]